MTLGGPEHIFKLRAQHQRKGPKKDRKRFHKVCSDLLFDENWASVEGFEANIRYCDM